MDALIDKYFTVEEGKVIRKELLLGHDIPTNNKGINKTAFETMIIMPITDRKTLDIETGKPSIIKGVQNGYEVTYYLKPLSSNSDNTKLSVYRELLVVENNGVLKISYITDNLRYHK
ncbi:hypothetical protein HK413_03325 [Mucilaginibacter sp. S1162]|uniref:Uncharacterized protein n=1 Tax=Mucilaginibacter humi TaxID=2732510 RepID=A0ABX1VZZ0_9SPHI|nr:hypothetical protein [Mucilaginibacter humi]